MMSFPAIMAKRLSEQGPVKGRFPALCDVVPLSLGTNVKEDIMSVIIRRNTPIPCSHCETYITTSDDQTQVGIDVSKTNTCR